MKKYFIALLFGLSLTSMQTASAAMLNLTQIFGGGAVIGSGTDTVTGSSLDDLMLNPTNASIWKLDLSGLGPSGLADLDFDLNLGGITGFDMSFTGSSDFKNLSADTYFLSLFPKLPTVSYNFTLSATDVSQVPVPAAVWLFGSALLGLVGFTTRKPQTNLAA
jgi:hypothetical protein